MCYVRRWYKVYFEGWWPGAVKTSVADPDPDPPDSRVLDLLDPDQDPSIIKQI